MTERLAERQALWPPGEPVASTQANAFAALTIMPAAATTRSDVNRTIRRAALTASTGALLLCGGCANGGPALVDVTGKVTLDGNPLPDAYVRFIPEVTGDEQMRTVIGKTDAEGEYVLEYSTDRHGAAPGKYKVVINTGVLPEDGPKGIRLPGAREVVPSVYNIQSQLKAEVGPENRRFDFELKSDAGRIVQPYSDGT